MPAPRAVTPAHRRSAPLSAPAARLLDAAFLGVLALFFYSYVSRHAVQQGDLRTYLTAARAALAGLDPYAPGTLAHAAGRPLMPFVYPPVALLPFMALAGLPAAVAMAAFMWAKVVVLAALVVGWWRRYVPRASVIAVALLALYGANRSAQWDLAAGNVALFECALLYAAFDQWLNGRRAAFAALVVAASLFKLTPAVFLLLLLVPLPGHAARPRLFALACAVLAALVAGPMLVGPASHYTPFWAHVPDATSYTESNPSSLGFFTVALSRLGFAWAQPAGLALWVAYVVALLAASRAHLLETARLQHGTRWLMTAVLLYVLVHPRVMAYGYVLATPALFYFMPRPFAGRVGSLLLALVLSAQGLLVQLTNNMSGSLLVLYAPWFMTLSVWLLAATRLPREAAEQHDAPMRRAA